VLLAYLDAMSLDIELVSSPHASAPDRYVPQTDHAKAAVEALDSAAA
jgi:hypothetical protein